MQLRKLLTLLALLCAAGLLFACGGGGGSEANPAAPDQGASLLMPVASFPLPDSGAVHGPESDPSQLLGAWESDCRRSAQNGFTNNSKETMRVEAIDPATNSLTGRFLIKEYGGDGCQDKDAIPHYFSYDMVATPATALAAPPGAAFTGSAMVYRVRLTPRLDSSTRDTINDSYTIALYDSDPRTMRLQENGSWITPASRSWVKR